MYYRLYPSRTGIPFLLYHLLMKVLVQVDVLWGEELVLFPYHGIEYFSVRYYGVLKKNLWRPLQTFSRLFVKYQPFLDS